MDSPSSPTKTLSAPASNSTAEVLSDLSHNVKELTETLKNTKANEKAGWKEIFIKYTQRFAIALAAIAILGAIVGAIYAGITIGWLAPVTLIIASAASIGLIVALIAYGVFKLKNPSVAKPQVKANDDGSIDL